MKYELDDKPGVLPMLMYGLQWFIVSLPSLIIIGIVAGGIHSSGEPDLIFYLQKLFGIMGIATVVQVLWGHKLPLVIGPASVLLIGVISTSSSGSQVVYTSIMIGGLLLAVIAYSGLLKKIQFIFTPRVVTVILIMIALTLSPVILKLITKDAGHASAHTGFALTLVFILVIINRLLKGIWQSTTIVWGILGGSIAYFLIFGFPASVSSGEDIVSDQSLFIFPLEFNVGAILAFIFCFIALIVNELGSIEAVAHMLKAGEPDKRVSRGVGVTGITNVLSGLLGVIGPVDYSMSAGIISSTKCASRYVLVPAGIALFLCSLFPSAVRVLSGIPDVVMGCILLYLMSSQFASGLIMLVTEKAIQNFNNALTVGLSIMVALFVSYAPERAFEHFPSILHPIIGNGFVMGVITVLILEHIVFRQNKKT